MAPKILPYSLMLTPQSRFTPLKPSPLNTFHIVTISPWPIIASFLAGATFLRGLGIFNHTTHPHFNLFFIVTLLLTATVWWRDITREATVDGHHTLKVQTGLRMSIIIFITSEVMFFFAFFWAFFHRSLTPTHYIGAQWPPTQITPLNAFSVPLLNTGVLLRSGITVTWSHHAILQGDIKETRLALFITILLGAYFTLLQASEYARTTFSFNDRVYGSRFFLTTGFHGAHVLIGSSFLLVCLIRSLNNHFSISHHFGFEAAAWYWHFVDVVWLFLYTFIYWWGA